MLYALSLYESKMGVESSNPIPSCRSKLTWYYNCLQIVFLITSWPENGKKSLLCLCGLWLSCMCCDFVPLEIWPFPFLVVLQCLTG